LEDLKKLLCQHHKRYPQLEPVDLVKLIYQNEFGVGHFIDDEGASLARLAQELAGGEINYLPAELFEPIGGGLVRLQRFLPVFKRIEQLLAEERPRILVAIDGRSSAGKSFLGQLLKDVYECPVIAMDHFFLRPEQRTPNRLGTPGGNIDYERFALEVLPNLKANQPFSYQIYNCQQNNFKASPTIASHRLMIVEGSYSHHPILAENYDFKVFLTVSPEIQKGRILKRNGPLMLKRFIEEWIPLEERYVSALDIARQSDLLLDTGE
jgi:uridine kinase